MIVSIIKKIATLIFPLLILVILFILYAIAASPQPKEFTYGASFNTPYARELGLDWRKVYTAMLDDLEIRHLRLAAHWSMVEPEKDNWNFKELDVQLEMAEEYEAEVVFAVGRRLPRWPECHVPEWAKLLSWEEQKEELREYLTEVVNRYKDNPAIVLWQVENEPFLTVYAQQECGDLDKEFLDEEIALVHQLDPTRPVLVTDSGNLGTWIGAYRRGDFFGTSVYVYLWNEQTGPFRSFLPSETYMLKRKAMQLVFGKKETLLIELSAEPWLNKPIASTTIETQFSRMNIEKFEEIIEYAKKAGFSKQYLWGAEWWYWLKENEHPEFWERARALYVTEKKDPRQGINL